MKILVLSLTLVLLSFPSFGQTSERPEGIVLPVATLGDVSETRRQILQNTLIESLSSYYRLVPQDKLEEVQEKIFQEMDYEECTEDQCIVMIQEALQVENLFVLQVIGEGSDTQLSLKWVGLDDKKVKNDVCKGCGTFELNERVEGLVKKLESVIQNTGFVMSKEDQEVSEELNESVLKKNKTQKNDPIIRSSSLENKISFFSLSLFNPAQFPDQDSDIKGLRFNFIYGRHRNVSGVDLTFLGLSHTKKSKGIQLTWFGVNKTEEISGAQLNALGVNYSSKYSHTQFGPMTINYANEVVNQITFGFNIADNSFFQWSLGGNYSGYDSTIQFSIGGNYSEDTKVQIGAINYSESVTFQLGIINITNYLNGVQIGLINIHKQSREPFGYILPFINAKF